MVLTASLKLRGTKATQIILNNVSISSDQEARELEVNLLEATNLETRDADYENESRLGFSRYKVTHNSCHNSDKLAWNIGNPVTITILQARDWHSSNPSILFTVIHTIFS